MTSDVDEAPKETSELTRRAVIDHFSIAKLSWAGRLQDDEFLARLYDLSKLPSFDHRYQDAAGDRKLVAKEPETLAPTGLRSEVGAAIRARRQWLLEQGLARTGRPHGLSA